MPGLGYCHSKLFTVGLWLTDAVVGSNNISKMHLSAGYTSCPENGSTNTTRSHFGDVDIDAVDDKKHHCYFAILFAIWLLHFLAVFRSCIFLFVTTTVLSDWNDCRRKRAAMGAGIPRFGRIIPLPGIMEAFPLYHYTPSSALVLCATTPSSDEHVTSHSQIHASTCRAINSR